MVGETDAIGARAATFAVVVDHIEAEPAVVALISPSDAGSGGAVGETGAGGADGAGSSPTVEAEMGDPRGGRAESRGVAAGTDEWIDWELVTNSATWARINAQACA